MTEYERITYERDKFFLKNYGVNSIIWEAHILKGATLRKFKGIEESNVRHRSRGNTNSDMNNNNVNDDSIINISTYEKYDPSRYDMENLFAFNYDNMIKCKPDKKFNVLLKLVFAQNFPDIILTEQYNTYINMYNDLVKSGDIYKVNDIYQRLSTYISENHLCADETYVDGSIICNIALMISNYLRTGKIETEILYYNNIYKEDYVMDIHNSFHLFLILQCFTCHNQYKKKYINGKYVHDWWAIYHIRRRRSTKAMKTKGLCFGFRNKNGEAYYLYNLINKFANEDET